MSSRTDRPMLRRPLTRLTTLIAVIALAGPASAQGANPLDWLFGRKAAPQAPAPAETAAPASPAMPATAVLPPKRPTSLPVAAEAAPAHPAAASQPQAAPRPPVAATASISPAALNEP